MKFVAFFVLICASLAFAGFGDDTQGTCAINSFGNKLCGKDALAYCDLIETDKDKTQSITRETCKKIRGKIYGKDYVDAQNAGADIAKRYKRCVKVEASEFDKCMDTPIDPEGNCLPGYIRRTPKSACSKS